MSYPVFACLSVSLSVCWQLHVQTTDRILWKFNKTPMDEKELEKVEKTRSTEINSWSRPRDASIH